MQTSCKTLAEIAETIGFEGAVNMAAFFGGTGQNLHIPQIASPDHVIAKVIGMGAFQRLVDARGGERINVPSLDMSAMQAAGRVYVLHRRNISASQTARLLNLSPERVRQIVRQLELEGFAGLAADLEDGAQ